MKLLVADEDRADGGVYVRVTPYVQAAVVE